MEYFGFLICMVVICDRYWKNALTSEINFTKPLYHVSVYQDQGVKQYVIHSEFRMGVFKPVGNNSLSFKIREKQEILNTFMAESYLLGDFYYLRIRTKFFATLNRERIKSYNLTVEAVIRENNFDDKVFTSTQVHVRVLDRNDNCPIFNKEIFDFVISEDASFATNVGTVTATDADEGINAEIFYYTKPSVTEAGHQSFPFSLNPLTGIIHLTQPLHMFAAQKLSSKIAAIHRGDPSIINCDVISQALVVVSVIPNNRHSPFIDVRPLSVYFDPFLNNYPYAEVKITDEDDINKTRSQSYPVVIKNSSVSSLHFSLSPTSTINKYILKIRHMQPRNVPDSVIVVLEAIDIATAPRVTTLAVKIVLAKYKDISLLTMPSMVSLIIPENTIVNSSVLLLRPLINGSNSDSLTSLTFRLVLDGASHDEIEVSQTGVVSVRRELNAEDVYMRERTLTVAVASPQWQTATRNVQIRLTVTDINEYPPMVSNNGSIFQVAEDVLVGSTLFHVEAYDPDVSRTTLSYYLFDEGTLPVTLAPHARHTVVLKSSLDAETMPNTLRVRVLITDSGLPITRSTIAHYVIEIVDVNEYSPEFAHNYCNLSISRNLAFDSRLGFFLAEDLDRDGRHNVRISIASISLQEPCFSVDDQSGSLVLLCSLMNRIFTKVRNFVIRLQASDGRVSPKQLALNVTVVEPNDLSLFGKSVHQKCDENNVYSRLLKNLESLQKHYFQTPTDTEQQATSEQRQLTKPRNLPQFLTNIGSVVHVREEVPLGHVVQTIEMKTYGNDGRDPFESVFVFGLWSVNASGDQVFVIDQTSLSTARIIVGDRLDRERVNKYGLVMAVCDNGQPRYCVTRVVTVRVEDINDQRPVFLDSFQGPIELPENHPVTNRIVQVTATDQDEYNIIQYKLVNFRNVFKVHKRTGWLRLRVPLDREEREKYTLVITASDLSRQGRSLTSTFTISIIVTDVNDNKPLFTRTSYLVTYPEDLPLNSFLVQLHATDADSGNNGLVRYALHGLQADCFRCDEVTGTIHLNCPLSSSITYRLIAVVKDNGRPQALSSQADLIVRVLRVSPRMYPLLIREPLILAHIKENCLPGTLVTSLRMEDTRTSPGQFIFTISGQSSGISKFQISNNGEIRTIGTIDRERHSSFWLFIYVEDRHEVFVHRTIAEVFIDVLDDNDNWPMPHKASYVANVAENLSGIVDVVTVLATDEDAAVNTTLKFKIIAGDPMGHFSISRTGTIKTTERSIDRESSSGGKSTCLFSDSYDLKVSISDSGTPERVTTVHVHVNIDDTNDNHPMFLNNHRFVFNHYLPTGALPYNDRKISIGKVVAVDADKDLNGTVRYSMVPGYQTNESNSESLLEIFSVDVQTGRIHLNLSAQLIYESRNGTAVDNGYEFKVWAYDLGIPTQWSVTAAKVTVRLFPQNNASKETASDAREGLHLAYQLPDTISLLYDECIGYELLSIPVVDALDPSGSGLQVAIEDNDSYFAIFWTRRASKSRYEKEASLVVAQSLVDAMDTYILRIMIRNGQIVLRHNITVTIKFYNNQSPVFVTATSSTVSLNISDRTPLSSVIFKAIAKCPEIELPRPHVPNSSNTSLVASTSIADIIMYSISASNDPDSVQQLFYLHSNNGDLSLVGTIQAHRGRTFQIIVEARRKRSTYLKLQIHVTESINMAPQFLVSLDAKAQYSGRLKSLLVSTVGGVEEQDKSIIQQHLYKNSVTWFGWLDPTSVVGTIVATVPAFDHDRGDNGRLTYSIKNDSMVTVYFSMDTDSGDIRVARDLTHLINRVIFLGIMVRDHGSPSLSNHSVVAIHIRMSTPLDRLPQIEKTQLELVVPENVPVNTVLHCLKLRHSVHVSMPIEFVLLKTTPANGNLFGVTRTTGCIITASVIDRELNQGPITLDIQVQLHTGQTASYNSISTIKIHIADVNDNAPRFLCALHMSGVISESANPGSVIFMKSGADSESLMRALIIQVEDPDEGENGTVDYSLTSSVAASHFQVDSHTGVLSLAAPVDREVTGDLVILHVQLSDRGRPMMMSHQVLEIAITILDDNDCPPRFEKDFYIQNLLLPTYANAPIIQFRVTDDDLGNKMVFSISDGNIGSFFSLDRDSGWLTINADNVPLSNEIPRVLLMNIRVHDGVHHTMCNITIYCVDDATLRSLPLEHTAVTWTIPENEINVPALVLPRPSILYISKSLSQIRYVLLSLHSSVSLDQSLGCIRLTNSLDREREPYFSLLVLARGWDGSHGYINVSVKVTDINDFKPTFLTDLYSFLVDTNSSSGVQSLKVTAIDLDSGNNGTVSYSIDYLRPYTDEIRFSINSSSGVISVPRPPAGTMVGKRYSLVVRATDDGRPRLSSTSNVIVDIVSDKSPLFSSGNYTISMWEDAPRGSVVTTVHASSSTGHTILYTISTGNDDELFELDFTTGVIRLIGALDYETRTSYTLVITATDPSSSLSHYTSVFVTVLNRPDEEPVFTNESYSLSISENIPLHSVIYTLSVLVTKTPTNKAIFSLEDISSSGPCNSAYFSINKVSGQLSIVKTLDFEVCEIHQFWIAAIFDGGFSKSTKVIMKVSVEDVNDNAPVFMDRNMTAVISSQSLPNSLVVIATATDIDTNTKLQYKIIDASHHFFKIDQYTGFVRFNPGPSSAILVSRSQFVTFKVLVHDTIHSATANVSVTLLSTNNNAPSFKQKVVHMMVPENATIGTELGRLSATDQDLMEFGSLQFRFVGGFDMGDFNLDKQTGSITVKQSLDRERKKVYELRVRVSDGGGKQDFADVLIHITDINDHSPVFDQSYYEVTVSTNQHSLPILQLQARDKDQSPRYRMDYRLVYPSQELSPVNIDPITGQVTLKPDWVNLGATNQSSASSTIPNLQVYSLLVQVSERAVVSFRFAGLPVSYGSKVPVTINVFSQPLKYIPVVTCSLKSVSENNEPQELVAICRVSPPRDNGRGKWSLIFSESSEEYRYYFEIDSSAGHIRVRKSMDYEHQSQYRLTVEYRDVETVSVATRSLVIDLIDQNDCSPIFDNSGYSISVAEDITVGTRLMQCKAVDMDYDAKDKVRYSIDRDSLFRIDEFGWIYVISTLDYEREKVLHIVVFASDSANHVTNITVTVSLIDINDELPFWTRWSLRDEVEIVEDCDGCTTNVPRVIYRLEARDNDTVSQTEPLRFLISNQNMSPYLSYFSITKTGEIELTQAVDAEKITGPLELRILASDGLHWSMDEFVLLVRIQDVNDHSPICAQQSQHIVLSEDTKPGSVITTVKAYDRDISAKFNTVTYKLLECSDPYLLVVDSSTGAVIINAPLDREFKSEIRFKVEASDIGLKKCSLSVQLTVTDVNDNEPRFTQVKIAPVPENAPFGSVIGKIHAEDSDAGVNRRIEYSIIDDPKSCFSIDRRTGIMRVTGQLDRELVPVHKVVVSATDGGRPMARSSSVTVTIELLDINDSPPHFLGLPLQVNVSEDAVPGSLLLTIKAVSEDLGQNSVISYHIVMSQHQFTLNSSSGDLILAKTLDYERNKEYFLSVVASDGGYPSLSTTTVVTIHVRDVNDNAPVFPRQPYLFTLMENMPIGRSVGKITAIDADSNRNGKVTYSIVTDQSGTNQSSVTNPDRLFQLRPDNGEIVLRFVPDREQQTHYRFQVMARDQGLPSLMSITMVTIEIEDMNDNTPVFDKQSYRFLIQVDRSGIIPRGELQAAGDLSEVGRMSVTDKDGPTNSRPFVCNLLNAEISTSFTVKMDDKTDQCVLLVSGLLHLGSRNLIVQVNDNGLTTLYQRSRITVDVIRLSNIPPEIEPLNVTYIYFHSFNTVKKEATVTRVLVKDRSHAYDKLKFELILNSSSRPQDRYVKDLFHMDGSSGVVTTLDQLDSGVYPLLVRVTNGSLATQRMIFIKIVALTQEMVDSSCVIQLSSMKPNVFFARRFDERLVDFLKRAMASKWAYIISAKASLRQSSNRQKRQISSDDTIDILVSVYDENENRFFKSHALVTRISGLLEDLSRTLEVNQARVFDNVCSDKHVCVQGQCQTSIKITPQDSVNRFQVHGVTFSSPDFIYSSVCKCDPHFGGERCQIPLNKCAHKPCGHIRVCRSDPGNPPGFVCECPAFKKGDNCDQVMEIESSSSCLDEQCVLMRESEPVHFNGGGYLRWILGHLCQTHRIDVNFGFRVLQKPAPLLEIQWNSLRSLAVDISERGTLVIQSGYKTIPEFDMFESHSAVSDGRWHSLRVSIIGVVNMPDWWLHVVLDGVQPRLHSLDAWMEGDTANQTILLAARHMLLSDNKWDLLSSSTAGCFRDMTVNGMKMPYQQLPVANHHQTVKVLSKNLNFGCLEKLLSSYCGVGVCRNAGLCRLIDDSNVSYSCQCQGPFTGKDCAVFQEPCKFSPCLHGGKCGDLADGYTCACPQGLSGSQCQWGRACASSMNLCPASSSCIEHLISEQSSTSVCRCPPTFQGYLCQTDVDECAIRPPLCQPGKGACHNTHGGYQCNCSLGFSGQHCETDSLVPIHLDTSTLGLSQFHIYMIIGILACLFVLALLTVVVLVLRLKPVNNVNSRRKKDRNNALSLDPLYQIKAYSGDQCSRYSPASSMMASSIHHPPGYVGGFMVEPPPGTPGGRSQMSYQPGPGPQYRRLSQDAMDRMSMCSSTHGMKGAGTPIQMPAHYQKSSRAQMFLKPMEPSQGMSPHSSTFSLVPCNVGPQQHLHLVPNRSSMLVCHGSGHARVVYDPMMMANSNLSLHSSKGISSHWELNEEMATDNNMTDSTPVDGPSVALGHNLPMRQISTDTNGLVVNGDVEHSIMSWSGQYNDDPILNKEMISSQEMSFTETTDRSTALLLPRPNKGMMLHNTLPPVSSHGEAVSVQSPVPVVNGNKESPSTASPSSTSIPSGNTSSDTKGTAPVCDQLVLQKKGHKVSSDSNSAEGTECDTDDIEMDQQPVCPSQSTFPVTRHMQEDDVEDGLAAIPLLDSVI